MNTHGLKISFGKHKGELFTRLPLAYLRWMINEKIRGHDIAAAEFERRGDTMPVVELSGHAIDNASIRVRRTWHETKRKDEGLYSWLQRMTLEALESGERLESGKIKYNGMKLVIKEGEEFPLLVTITPATKAKKKVLVCVNCHEDIPQSKSSQKFCSNSGHGNCKDKYNNRVNPNRGGRGDREPQYPEG